MTGTDNNKKTAEESRKRRGHICLRYWYYVLIGLFFIGAASLYLICGENAHIEVQDNLDLFQAQYEMLKRGHAFFAQGTAAPFLGGVSRNVLPSELSLTSVLYMLFPSFTAYIVLYFVKIALAVFSFTLLAREVLPALRGTKASGRGAAPAAAGTKAPAAGTDLQDAESKTPAGTGDAADARSMPLSSGERGIIVLSGFAYGLLNMFPSFGISFASIPLYIYLCIRLYRAGNEKSAAGKPGRGSVRGGISRMLPYLLALFVYPFVSYFSYFGLFLLAYTCAALLWLWIRDRKFPLGIFLGIVVMAAGCVVFEYRLFAQMLFTDAVSIRTTMVQGNLSPAEVVSEILDVFRNGIFHADGLQHVFILPLCLAYGAGLNLYYIVKGQWRRIGHELYNLILLILVFNSVIYGLYDYAPARALIENLVPQMRGLQLNRTIFFSPFLWYAALCLICLRVYRFGESRRGKKPAAAACCRIAASLVPLFAIAVILRTGSRYNDLYSTARAFLYEKLKSVAVDDLSYREFYSTELFSEIKEDLELRTGENAADDGDSADDVTDDGASADDAGAQEACASASFATTEGKPAAEAEESYGELEREIYSDDGNYGVGSRVSSDVIAEMDFAVSDSGIDWAVAYGLHPAVLEYNGIPTLDGYLGFYDESYKDVFRKAIAPALDSWAPTAVYYDDWGARCYLYSGSENTIVQATRSYVTDPASSEIMIDEPALKALGCRYIFSRICLTNAEEKNLSLRGTYSGAGSPYTIYVYELN